MPNKLYGTLIVTDERIEWHTGPNRGEVMRGEVMNRALKLIHEGEDMGSKRIARFVADAMNDVAAYNITVVGPYRPL